MKSFKVYFFIIFVSIFLSLIFFYSLDRIIGNKMNNLYSGWNHKGYRGVVKDLKSKDQKRVAFFGGSVVAGYGVNFRDAIPYILEEKFVNEKIDVVNLGFNGNGIMGISHDVKNYLYLDYDLAVIHNGYNDCTIERFNKRSARNDNFFFRNFGYLPIMKTYIQEKLYLILHPNENKHSSEIISEYYEKKNIKMQKIMPKPKMCYDNVNNNLSENEIKNFKKHLYKFYVPKFEETLIFLEKKNIKTIIIIQPSYNDLRQNIQSDIIRKLSKQHAGVVLLDLSNKMDISDKKISYDNIHYTRLGNEMAVDLMYKEIINLIKTGTYIN